MDSAKKAKQRLKNYPILLAKCAKSASVYAKCVTQDFNVKHKACENEFREFKMCLEKTAREMKTKL